ncbi:MAG: nitrogenase-stabilizing/protective protein NifW [Alphaproteobacteria bacterium]|nr:nitrogenase-stabilizing/protective protein NifW [Alphaproteobacteria bacterium]
MTAVVARLQGLSAAEDFFLALGVPFEQAHLNVHRLHILKRYHDYLRRAAQPSDEAALEALHRDCLIQAYRDFVTSNARTEKVFKVFRDQAGQAFVGLDAIHVPATA